MDMFHVEGNTTETQYMRVIPRVTAIQCGLALLAVGAALHASAVRAQGGVQIINSFETAADMANVTIPDPASAVYVSHSQSNIGVTDGTQSLLLKLLGGGSAFSSDSVFGSDSVRFETTSGGNPVGYAAFAIAAANPSAWLLEFDLTLPAGSWDGADFGDGGTNWSFPVVALSYDDGTPGGGGLTGFRQRQLGANYYNITGTNKISLPLSDLVGDIPLPTNSNYYQVQFGANQRFQTPPAGGVNYYIDKLRLSPAPVYTPVTLFSWETPDNPATTDVNEALEGWEGTIGLNAPTASSLGDRYAHTNSVTDYKVTDLAAQQVFPTNGAKSLKIDTTSQDPQYVHPDNTTALRQSYAFRWGTNMILDSTLDEDDATMTPVETANAAKIAQIANTLANGASIQFDVVFSDPISDPDPDGQGVFQGGETGNFPNFLSFAMHVTDERGTFFQYDSPAFSGAEMQAFVLEPGPDGLSPDEPVTITMPLSGFTDRSGTAAGTLASSPPSPDSDFLRIGLALNFGTGPVIAHIDNFRVLTTLPLDADFDADGDVDAADLTKWKQSVGPTAAADADGDGDSDGNDFLIWQRQRGNGVAAAAAVPEPTAAMLFVCSIAGLGGARRRATTS